MTSDWQPSAGRPSAAVHVLWVESCLQRPDFCDDQAASDICAQISHVAPRHDSALRRPSHTKHAGCGYAFTVSCAVHHQRRSSCHLRAAQLQRVSIPHLKLSVSPERPDPITNSDRPSRFFPPSYGHQYHPPHSTLGSLSTSGPLGGDGSPVSYDIASFRVLWDVTLSESPRFFSPSMLNTVHSISNSIS
jgi:hypothetical protein